MSYSKSSYHSSLFYNFKLYAIKLNQCPIGNRNAKDKEMREEKRNNLKTLGVLVTKAKIDKFVKENINEK